MLPRQHAYYFYIISGLSSSVSLVSLLASARMLPGQHGYYFFIISGLFSSVSLISLLASARMLPYVA